MTTELRFIPKKRKVANLLIKWSGYTRSTIFYRNEINPPFTVYTSAAKIEW